MLKDLKLMLCDEEGATLIEYCLIISLVGIAAVAALKNFTSKIDANLSAAGSQMQ